jgi:hypothetical protein
MGSLGGNEWIRRGEVFSIYGGCPRRKKDRACTPRRASSTEFATLPPLRRRESTRTQITDGEQSRVVVSAKIAW